MNYKAASVGYVQSGAASDVWVQGEVIGRGPTGSFFIDDGSGSIECFTGSHTRNDIFTVCDIPQIVLTEHSSKRSLRAINEGFSPLTPCPIPQLGAYVALWGGVVCLIDSELANLRMRIVVDRWARLDNTEAKAEIFWLENI